MKRTNCLFLLAYFTCWLNLPSLSLGDSWKSNPMFSPKGDKIAFVSNITLNDKKQKLLYLMDADGNNIKELSETIGLLDDFFLWSPDGEKIVLIQDENRYNKSRWKRKDNIYIIDKNGSNFRNLTDNEGSCNQLAWSPDGEKIAFVKANIESNQPNEIWLVCLKNGATERLTTGTHPSWSLDSKKIAFFIEKNNGISAIGPAIGIISIDDDKQYYFTPKEKQAVRLSYQDRICWSPKGDKVFFTAGRFIFSINSQNTRNRNLTVYNGVNEFNSDLSISIDGKKLAFKNNFGIGVMDLNRSRRYESYGLDKSLEHTGAKISFRVIKNISGQKSDNSPSLSSDGKKIIFIRDGEIWTMSPNGLNQNQLTGRQTTAGKIVRK